MTVTTIVEKDQYTLTGAGTAFAFTFKIFAETELVVIREDTAGVETTLTLTTDYTVSASPWETGGTVTTITNYTDGVLTIKRALPRTQTKGYTNASEFPAETHEEVADRAVILIQEIEEKLSRVALLKDSTALSDIELPSPGAGNYLRWNAGGTALEAVAGTVNTDNFTQSGTDAVARSISSKLGEIVSAVDYGAVGDGVTDDTAAIQAGVDYLEANGGGVCLLPPGTYKTTSTITIANSGVFIVGYGPKTTVVAPNFDTTAAFEFDKATLMERVGIFNMEIAHTVSRTGTSPTIIMGRGYRMYAVDIEITGAAVGLQYGYTANPVETVGGRLIRFRANTNNHGIVCTSQAALFCNGLTLNGTPTNSSMGIRIEGYQDGLWVDAESTIEEHDTSVGIVHSSGNVANVYLTGCAFDRPIVYGLRIEPSGTGGVNGIFLNGVRIFDTVGSGNTDGIFIGGSSSGTFERIQLIGVTAHDLRQSFINANHIVTDLTVEGCVSMDGSKKSSAGYAGIDLQSLAHDRVTIVGNNIEGDHDYGIKDGDACTNIICTNNNVASNTTGALNNMGSVSKTRHINNNTGQRNPRSYLLGPFTYTNLPASLGSTSLVIPTSDGSTVAFLESVNSFPPIRAGRVSGIMVANRSARTAGTATFTVHVGGSAGTLTAVLDGTNPSYVTNSQDSGDTFAAGSAGRIGVRVVTDASWAPVTSEIVVWVEIEET